MMNMSECVHITSVGHGQDVLLIPGLASSPDVWSGLLRSLYRSHRVHLVHVAGFAGLPAPTPAVARPVENLVETLSGFVLSGALSNPIIVGHAMGGTVGLLLASRHPDSVSRLLVVESLPLSSLQFDLSSTSVSAEPAASSLRSTMMKASDKQFESLQTAAVQHLVRNHAARAKVVQDALRSDRTTVANATYELATTDVRPQLSLIKAPTLIIYGHEEADGPVNEVESTFRAAYSGLTHAEFSSIGDSRHFVMHDQPLRFEEASLTFIHSGQPSCQISSNLKVF